MADGREIQDTEYVDLMPTTSTESVMNNPSNIADQYLSIWDESDAATRRSLIAAAFTADASYVELAVPHARGCFQGPRETGG
jgi:hypothetical protein